MKPRTKHEWVYINAFNYAGNNYITWGVVLGVNEDGTHNFKHKVVPATVDEIAEAQKGANLYFTSIFPPNTIPTPTI